MSIYDTGFVIVLTAEGVALPIPKGSKAPAAIRFVGASVAYDPDALVLGDGTRIPGAVVTLGPPVPASPDLPEPLGTASSGESPAYSRGDHVHEHGPQLGGTLHAAVSVDQAGFMTPALLSKLNGIESGADVTDFANVSAALAAASAAVAFNNKKLSLVADPVADTDGDTQGARNAALAAAIAGVAPTSLTFTAGAGLTGGGTLAADRSFAVGAGSGITVNSDDVAVTWGSTGEMASAANANGGGSTAKAARIDHTHALPAASGSAPGTQSTTHYNLVAGATSAATNDAIIKRDGSGRAQVTDPSAAADIDTLGARDTAIAAALAARLPVDFDLRVHGSDSGTINPGSGWTEAAGVSVALGAFYPTGLVTAWLKYTATVDASWRLWCDGGGYSSTTIVGGPLAVGTDLYFSLSYPLELNTGAGSASLKLEISTAAGTIVYKAGTNLTTTIYQVPP